MLRSVELSFLPSLGGDVIRLSMVHCSGKTDEKWLKNGHRQPAFLLRYFFFFFFAPILPAMAAKLLFVVPSARQVMTLWHRLEVEANG